jgi:hypothetical protein
LNLENSQKPRKKPQERFRIILQMRHFLIVIPKIFDALLDGEVFPFLFDEVHNKTKNID